ncbi:MAG TPA: tetratricopeptide repeat protein [Dongiaceae bacterium]|jgi:tetratricopeptide (TPR) repeat protein|nr:tetratricopeptide repeat protein [Dongiaceae bacterium]
MATGALSTTPRRTPGREAVSQNGKARTVSPQDEARIATLFQAAGRAHQAENVDRLQAILEEILEIDPDHAKATYNLGILFRDRDDIFRAEVYLRRAIKLDPYMIDAFQGLGDILFGAKHLLPATEIYEQALERAPNRLPLLQNLAKARMMLKEAAEAERLARRILSIDDRAGEAWATLAWALLHRDGDPAETLEAAEQAERLGPEASYAPPLKEQALRRLGRVADADVLWAELLSAAARNWDKARAYNEVYYWLNRLDRCRAIATAFTEANPDQADGLKDLASLMMADGEFELAQEVLDRATAMAPDKKVVRMASGLNAFRIGQYQRGLALYSARWNRNTHDKPWDIPVPDWDGRPIDGHLIVYCEQGIGDYVMFALLFSELRRCAKSITIEVNVRIASLFRRSFPDMRVLDRNALPADWDPSRYQAKVGMGDLLSLLPIDIENLPNRQGFLIPEPALALKLRNRYRASFPGKRLVGISWRSGNRDSATIRSIDLSLWKPILETPDCAFISLQYGDVTRDLETLRAETGHVVHWDREVDPFTFLDPFTAQIAAMDLVISVDNSTVHFAGAIGKPCWVLLPLNSDWRWLVGRSKSIWYDSLDLIRQEKSEGWQQVVAKVAERLRAIGTEPLTDATAELCLRCGEELLRREAMAPAEDYFRWLMETGRHKAAAFHGVGKAAQTSRHFQDAAAVLGRAAELAPERIDYKADWSVALFEAGHRDAGERLARELTRRGNDPTALMAMGQILAAKGLLDQATDYFARVLRPDPGHVVARTILAGLQAMQGEDDLAHRNFARLVQQASDLPGPRTALAEIDLRHGRDETAWPNFAWRFGTTPEELPRHLAMMAPDDRPKSWSGGKIRKRRLFLRAERNALEQLLFAPWFADAQDDARALRAECDAAVLPLLGSAFPKIRFAGAGALTSADLIEDRTQIFASLADLAAGYAKNLAGGWLPADRATAASQRQRLLAGETNTRLVGLAWVPTGAAQGGLAPFAPLFEIPGIRWAALPMGPITPALAQFLSAPGCPLIFESTWMRDGLGSIAGLLAALDLLISGEDLAATLAGALGQPVWKIAGANAHWSWGADSAGSKWHPTARIFRAREGSGPPIAAMRADLEQGAGGR